MVLPLAECASWPLFPLVFDWTLNLECLIRYSWSYGDFYYTVVVHCLPHRHKSPLFYPRPTHNLYDRFPICLIDIPPSLVLCRLPLYLAASLIRCVPFRWLLCSRRFTA
jgi:hypothetical protein